MDFGAMKEAFVKADEKLTRDECWKLVQRACTPQLRAQWCKVFHLSEIDAAAALELPYPDPKGLLARPKTLGPFLEVVERASASPYKRVGFTEAEYKVIAGEVLMDWCHGGPRRAVRTPLDVMQDGSKPTSWEAFVARHLLPWVTRGTPAQPGNFPTLDRLRSAVLWWEGFTDAVYSNERLNGSVPGLRGTSLQWVSAPVASEGGHKIWHTLRLERILSGYYTVSERDKKAMGRAEADECRDEPEQAAVAQ